MRLWPRYTRCVICFGTGLHPQRPSHHCPDCGGVGTLLDPMSLFVCAVTWVVLLGLCVYGCVWLRG